MKSGTGLAALLLAVAGCVVFPLAAVGGGLFMHGDGGVTAVMVSLGLGGLAVVAAVILAIVALARGGEKAYPIAALVLSVASIPAGIFGFVFGVLFATGGGHGRPFRAGKKELRTPTTRGDAWSSDGPRPNVDGLAADVRVELAEAWLADAALEHASIAAFGALAQDLVALGAPPALIRGAHEAALDEVEHARMCFALASAYAGRSLTAAAFPQVAAERPTESADARLRRVAMETALDGCVGEGAAAAAAREAAGHATDPVVRAVLARIAGEEQRHADYAWEVLTWCLAQGDETLTRAVADAVARAPSPTPSGLCDALVVHGRIDEHAWKTRRTEARDALGVRLHAANVV